MTLEELTKAGFTEDQAKKILVMHQKSIDGNYIPKATFEDKLTKMAQENALKLAIADKVHNVEDILPKLDVTKITFKDGAVVAGLVEQMEALKKSNPYYFKEDNAGRNLPGGWTPFGRKPEEGGGSGSGSAEEEFGKSLAKAVSAGNTFAEKADKTYFG